MIPDARDVAHRILGVICGASGHGAACDRVTTEIHADRSARGIAEPASENPSRTKRIVYVAGKFRGPDGWTVAENIRAAERVGFEVARAGAMPLIPHSNTAHFDGTMTAEFWLDGTLELLRRCDAVMMVPGWPDSRGALGERDEAMRLGMPVFDAGDYQALCAWLGARS